MFTTEETKATQVSEAMLPRTEARMQCLHVWGGSGHANTSVSTTGLDVWLFSKPHHDDAAGGDIHYLSSCSSGRITRLALADVCGHGETVAAMARALRGVLQSHIDRVNQRTLVRSINQEFSTKGDAATFATGLVATYFLPTGTLSITNAGHPPPLLYSARLGEWRTLEGPESLLPLQNVPFGMFDAADYTQLKLQLGEGDLVLSWTDGLEECTDRCGGVLGREGLLEILRGVDPTEPGQIIPTIRARLASMSETDRAEDDVTIMLVRPNGAAVPLRDNLFAPFRYVANAAGLWR